MGKLKITDVGALVFNSTAESRNYPLLPGPREELVQSACLTLNNTVAKALKEANWKEYL